MCGTERVGEIVDNAKQKERVHLYSLHQPTTSVFRQDGIDCSPTTQLQAFPVSSIVRHQEGEEEAPSWWFYHFEPVWKPFLQRLCRQKNITLREFERAASQVPGLTHIEKTIAISAFHQQQEGLAPLHNTTAFRSEHNLSAV
jgi:hypothetical protein